MLNSGITEETVEDLRSSLQQEYHKQSVNIAKVSADTAATFADRRHELVSNCTPTAKITTRWPAQFLPLQVISVVFCL